MKKLQVFSFSERVQAGLLKELLDREGIPCLLRNDQLSSAVGEIPFVECRPELWVVDDEVYPRARMLLDAWLNSSTSDHGSWACPGCGEICESQFGACWACGTLRD